MKAKHADGETTQREQEEIKIKETEYIEALKEEPNLIMEKYNQKQAKKANVISQ